MFANCKAVEYYRTILKKWGKLLEENVRTKTRFNYDRIGSKRIFVVPEISYAAILRYTRSTPLAIHCAVNLKTVLRTSCVCKAEFHRHASRHCRFAHTRPLSDKYKMLWTNKRDVCIRRKCTPSEFIALFGW